MMNPLKTLRFFLAGILMGTAGVIPGVSSGTIALITGVYQKVIDALDILLGKKPGKGGALIFLLTIMTGMTLATFLLASLIESLLARFPVAMNILFMGLILGTMPAMITQIKHHRSARLQMKDFGWILLAFFGVVATGQFSSGPEAVVVELTLIDGFSLFIAGILSTGTAIIPGVSGSMLLMTLGWYGTMISAISSFHWPLLALLGVGSLVGFILFSKIIKFLLEHYTATTYALITGFLLGSVVHILPEPLDFGGTMVIGYFGIFFVGFLAVLLLGSQKRYV